MQLQMDPKGLLIAGAAKLWLWNPAEPKALATFPPQFEVSGMVRTPGKGNEGAILISGYHSVSEEHPKPKDFDATESLCRLAAGKKAFVPVFVRRLERVTAAPVFSGERMVFGGSCDVWEGGVEVEEQSELPPTLWGQHIAPLAMCNTDRQHGCPPGDDRRGHHLGDHARSSDGFRRVLPASEKGRRSGSPRTRGNPEDPARQPQPGEGREIPSRGGRGGFRPEGFGLCSLQHHRCRRELEDRLPDQSPEFMGPQGAKGPVPIGTETSEEGQ